MINNKLDNTEINGEVRMKVVYIEDKIVPLLNCIGNAEIFQTHT
jgi:hypothetical protein